MCTLNLNYVILSMSFIFPQAYCCRLWCERGLHGHQHICPVPMESRLENTWHIKKATQRSSRYKGILAEFAKNNLQSALESLVS